MCGWPLSTRPSIELIFKISHPDTSLVYELFSSDAQVKNLNDRLTSLVRLSERVQDVSLLVDFQVSDLSFNFAKSNEPWQQALHPTLGLVLIQAL